MAQDIAKADAKPANHAVSISDLDVYHLDWDTPEFAADPHSRFEAARQKHPWLANSNSGYVVFDLHAIRTLLSRDDQMRTSFDGIVDIMNARGSAWGRFAEEQMIALPDREHRIIRDAFAARFTPRQAGLLRPIMRQQMELLLADWTPRKHIDFEEFASYYPVSVMTRMIGAPLEAIPALRSSMETMGLAFSMNPDLVPKLDEAMLQLDEFAYGLLAARRAAPHADDQGNHDLLDLLIDSGKQHDITERQLADMLIFLFVAGYDTSKNVFTYIMHELVHRPEIYERCANDLDYCAKVIEEGLRMFTPASTFRATKKDIVYKGVLIPKDTMLFFTLNVTSRISHEVDNSYSFDPERVLPTSLRHVGFGLGKHMCLGQYIARVQLQEGLHLIAQQMRNPRETGVPGWRPYPGVWGMKGLPIEFEPAA